ncbi:hypothetical protein P9W99_26730 [Bacillus cereus]|uniref:Uncharacterized protein n=1 Tax=Bacillus cereus ISP2954 TaxID=1053215 RepID=A0A9W5VHN5_BACCE|nr:MULTISPECIES: hypothetical protein [Bacillus cereus group]QCW20828.1 hypothetical protein WG69_0055 [Bacillus phage vB_BthS-TP21T]AGE75984.1 hypothetical protein HD73_0404 [Bacillus thuringiensis serovar kurstaki str. HD73]AJK40357.1 hypothetical protein BG08_5633 [Bacillus thuringiensis serovar kurstaki]EJV74281.1 hypothetical protein IG1_05466 [Bacillus cereus HD73]EOP45642.1 hypothetical protein IGG_05883 [Bacillus cereus HuB13-1]
MGLEIAAIWLSFDMQSGEITDNYRDNVHCKNLNEQELKWVVNRAKEQLEKDKN